MVEKPVPKELNLPIKWQGPNFEELSLAYYQLEDITEPIGMTTANMGIVSLVEQIIGNNEIVKSGNIEFARIGTLIDERLVLLAEHLGTDSSQPNWHYALCIELAQQIYPGFRVDFGERKGGRPAYGIEKDLEITTPIENIMIENKCGLSAAIRILIRKGEIKEKENTKGIKSVANEYNKATRRLDETFARIESTADIVRLAREFGVQSDHEFSITQEKMESRQSARKLINFNKRNRGKK